MRAKLIPIKPAGLDELELDVTVSISEVDSASIANHPVEAGEVLTDEVNLDQKQVQIELVFLNLAPSIANPSAWGRADRLLSRLRSLYRAKALLTFEPPDEPSVPRLVIQSIGVSRDPSTGRKRPVSLSLVQIVIANFDLEDTILDSDLEAFGSLTSIDIGLQP